MVICIYITKKTNKPPLGCKHMIPKTLDHFYDHGRSSYHIFEINNLTKHKELLRARSKIPPVP